METFLLFVQQLKAEGLYAADDPSLVTQQLHPNMSHISTPKRETHTKDFAICRLTLLKKYQHASFLAT